MPDVFAGNPLALFKHVIIPIIIVAIIGPLAGLRAWSTNEKRYEENLALLNSCESDNSTDSQ